MQQSPGSPQASAAHLFRPLVVPPAETFRNVAALMGHDTEAGRMLARLYARQATVSAPPRASKSRPLEGPQPPMQGLNARGGAADPRERRFDRAAVAAHDGAKPAPGLAAPAPRVHAIDRIKGISRSKAQIDAFEAAHAPVDKAMPPLRKGYDGEAEKRRLQQTFALKGGKAVPDAASYEPIEGAIPLHLVAGATAANARRMRGGGDDDDVGSSGGGGAFGGGAGGAALQRARGRGSAADSSMLGELERTFAEVQRGLEESVETMKELRALRAATARHEAEHRDELARRTRQLEQLDARIRAERTRLAGGGAGGPGGGAGGGETGYD